jgi:hypothetical protein
MYLIPTNPRPNPQHFLINAIILIVAQAFHMTIVLREQVNNFEEGHFGEVFFSK